MRSLSSQRGFGIVGVIVAILAVALVAAAGWYVWQTQLKKDEQNKPAPSMQHNESQSPSASTDKNPPNFTLAELIVGFDPKPGITPLYFIQDWSYNGVNYKLVRFSTKQLVDKGASEGTPNPCQFSTTAFTDTDYSLLYVPVFDSQADLLMANRDNPGVTADKLKAENGYLTIGGKVFVVPQNVQSGSGYCTQDADFQSSQWTLLQQLLMTLRAAQ